MHFIPKRPTLNIEIGEEILVTREIINFPKIHTRKGFESIYYIVASICVNMKTIIPDFIYDK